MKAPENELPPRARKLLGQFSDREIARRTGISRRTIGRVRRRLGIKPGKRLPYVPQTREVAAAARQPMEKTCELLGVTPSTVRRIRRDMGLPDPPRPTPWTKRVLARLGKVHDAEIAAEIGFRIDTVARKRRQLGRPALPPDRLWTPKQDALLGKYMDAEIARELGRSVHAVLKRRLRLGLEQPPRPSPWTKRALAQLGKVPDEEIAAEIGVVVWAVARMRRELGKPPAKRHRRRTRLRS